MWCTNAAPKPQRPQATPGGGGDEELGLHRFAHLLSSLVAHSVSRPFPFLFVLSCAYSAQVWGLNDERQNAVVLWEASGAVSEC